MSTILKPLAWLLPLFLMIGFVSCTTGGDETDIIEGEYDELSEEIDDELGDELDSEFDDVGEGDDDFEDDDFEDDDSGDEDFEDDEFADDDFEDEDSDIEELDDSFDDEDFADDDDEDFDDDEEFDEDDEELALDEDEEDFEDDDEDFSEDSGLDAALANQLENQVPPIQPNSQVPQDNGPIDTKIVEAQPSLIPNDDLGRPDPLVLESRRPQRPSWIPVKKIKVQPFRRGGDVLNTVYIARPGDTLRSISKKIYGTAVQASTLEKNNSYLAGGVDPGDKVYYNSPNRPGDNNPPIKVFHEDTGLAPQIYTTSAKDDMRRLGAKLLGFQAGWKEIWAINPNVASKSTLPPGIEVRYWTGAESEVLAEQTAPPMDEPILEESIEDEVEIDEDNMDEVAAIEEEALPEPIVDELEEDLDNPEPDETAFAGTTNNGDPNLGDGGATTAAPAVGTVAKKPKKKGKSLLMMGAFGLGVIFLAALVAVGIKNRKEDEGLPPSMEYTQV